MSRSRLVSQSNKDLNSNNEQLPNASDLSLIMFSVILSPNPRGKYSINSQISLGPLDENNNFKVCTIKILLDSGASSSIVHKDVLYKSH